MRRFAIATALTSTIALSSTGTLAQGNADTVLLGNKIYTGNPQAPWA